MYCQSCGVENPEEALYCFSCGNHFSFIAHKNDSRFQSTPKNVIELHKTASFYMENKLFKQAWKTYFEILDINANDQKALKMVEDLKMVFRKNNYREKIASRVWFVVALIASIAVFAIILILSQ